ncbi:hypothetical protein C5Y93_11995 [Blastopirellula marina]|uniref:Glycosyltransferase family 1 protein n=1 Tax=Blastopirellula marina TaxID=124 RepID=A0A2S8GNE7_9BACT|nr:hypothetical protein C5Y93_11995 [Blastopirellula marina]
MIPKFRRLGQSFSPSESRLLLVSALTPLDLDLLDAIPNWRQAYSTVVAFITDSFVVDWYKWARNAKKLDAIFVPIESTIEATRNATQVPVYFLPFGADCLKYSKANTKRWIDVIGYGRQPALIVEQLEQLGNGNPEFFFLRETPSRGSFESIRNAHFRLLNASKCALAFDTSIVFRDDYKVSILTPRWAESFASGCVVAGACPLDGPKVFDWEGAFTDVPTTGAGALDAILELLSDDEAILRQSTRNVMEMCEAHDWRHRIRSILHCIGSPIPDQLTKQLDQLEQRVVLKS